MSLASSTLFFLLLALRFGLWLDDRSTPAYQAWLRKKRVWKAEDRQARQRRREARRSLRHRHRAMARCYWQRSVWSWWLYLGRAGQCRTDAVFNRYVTLAEQHWALTALGASAPPARSSVGAPGLPAQ